MRVTKQVVVKRIISIEEDQFQFRVRAPGSIRSYLINLIEISGSHFFLYGSPGRRKGACFPIHHGYSSVDEIPGMPFAVAHTVRNCLKACEDEGAVANTLELVMDIPPLSKLSTT